MKVLDLPFIHHYKDNKDNYIYRSLAKSENPEIFEKTAIKALIEQKWELTKWSIIYYLLLPYLAFLLVLTYFTALNLEDYNAFDNPRWDSIICRVLILLFVIYFTSIEVIQLLKEGFKKHI